MAMLDQAKMSLDSKYVLDFDLLLFIRHYVLLYLDLRCLTPSVFSKALQSDFCGFQLDVLIV